MKGLNNIQAKLKKYKTEIDNEIDLSVKKATLIARNTAIAKAPIDNGQLRQGINLKRLGRRQMRLFSQMPYTIFQEFGTGKNVTIPEDAPESMKIAAQKMRSKSLGIKNGNIKPKLFMYAGFKDAKAFIEEDLKKIISKKR